MIVLFTQNEGTTKDRAWVVQLSEPVKHYKLQGLEYEQIGREQGGWGLDGLLAELRGLKIYSQILRMGKSTDFAKTSYNYKYKMSC